MSEYAAWVGLITERRGAKRGKRLRSLPLAGELDVLSYQLDYPTYSCPDNLINRRSFITKALAGLAAVPLIGKVVQARPQLPPVYKGPIEYGEVKYVLGNISRDAEMRRKQMLAYVRSNGYMETRSDAVSRMFEDFDSWAEIHEFCEEHGLVMQARPNGLIRISMLWRISVVNTFATLG